MQEELKNIIANNLTELRKYTGLTQADVAKVINYSDKTISKWEHGDTLPDVEILCLLANVYGVTVDDLVHENAAEKLRKHKGKAEPSAERNNRIIIASMSVAVVYLIATTVFVYSVFAEDIPHPVWQAFIWGIPASAAVLWYFNRRWMKNRLISTILLSIVCWSLITSIYLMNYNLWLIFVIGIPIQIIILLGTRITK
ncbi:MAG: helix-turn-helix transcriptional regulator [Clostridia bacterium]|nr:helix-turn-helix transcriptional regulator [Clostridia bacterium]